MGAMQRTKGRAGEQEFARLCRANLPGEITRNWQAQSAQGGADISGIPGWAVEVKRAKRYLPSWWKQAAAQARKAKAHPALAYRLDGTARGKSNDEKWTVEVFADFLCDVNLMREHRISMTAATWFYLVKTIWRQTDERKKCR